MVLPLPYRRLAGLVEVPRTPSLRRELGELPEGPLWLVGHRGHRHIPRIAAVWDWLASTFDLE